MPIFYALIAKDKTVLTEYTSRSGNFPTVTRMVLAKIDASAESKMSYIYDDYVFHYQVDDGVTYLCLADEKQKRRIPFLFLADMRDRFVGAYGDRVKTARTAFAMNDFARVIRERMEYFNDNPSADSFGKVQNQLAEVKDIMVENIEKVLARGDKIELLVDKSEALNQSARLFQKQSRALKNVMWWKNIKMWIIIGLIVAVLIFAITTFACGGFSYEKCK